MMETRHAIPGGHDSSGMARGKVATGDAFHDVDTHGGNAHPQHVLVPGGFDLRQHRDGGAEFFQRDADAVEVLGLFSHPQVDVLGEPGLGVEADGVAPHDQVVNPVSGEDRQ